MNLKATIFCTILLLQLFVCNYLFCQHYKQNQKDNKSTTDTCRCNWNCWPNLTKIDNHITETEMFFFLYTIRETCKNDAEFSEVSNAALFKIIELHAAVFLQIINKFQRVFDYNYILLTLKNPVNDGIDVKKVISNLNAVEGYNSVKKPIINALQIALTRM